MRVLEDTTVELATAEVRALTHLEHSAPNGFSQPPAVLRILKRDAARLVRAALQSGHRACS